ncbi:hypothetical protein C8J56DRAFT_551039 [Mycena floridula]|nr:hypothetical protein C8J56DRAFT_551039 [Mycena floridula]
MSTTNLPRLPLTRPKHAPTAFSSGSRPTSPITPPSPRRIRRPSISTPMHWLSSRNSSQSKPAPQPIRISEPLASTIGRSGALGSGATVVQTPEEALEGSGVRMDSRGLARRSSERKSYELSLPEPEEASLRSPPLPPLPQSEVDSDEEEPELYDPRTKPGSEFRFPQVPALPHLTIPSPPAFKPLLLSDLPSFLVDRSKVIVTLETCTATFRTTLETLTSRPSYLASYMESLFPRARSDSTASSVYSTADSDDISTFRRHLASEGLLATKPSQVARSPCSVHIFLDRSSSPYGMILNYLRTPVGQDALPRAVQLPKNSSSPFELLLELRDEASYLGLEDLSKLCTEEIRHRQVRRIQHGRGPSAIEPLRSSESLDEARSAGPPTPRSLNDRLRHSRSQSRNECPPGWI